MTREIGKDIWTVDGPDVVFTGISINTRMTIVRLDDDSLWIHSPIELSNDVSDFVSGLGGNVAALVAPNKLHYMFIEPWRNQFPDAVVFAHADLKKKVPSLADSETLTEVAPSRYADSMDQVLFSGNPVFREAVFFHRSSATVIFTDLMQNLKVDDAGLISRLYAKFDGVASPNGGVPRLYKWFTTDKNANREALKKILAWSPKNVLFCHGDPIQLGAMELLHREFSYLN